MDGNKLTDGFVTAFAYTVQFPVAHVHFNQKATTNFFMQLTAMKRIYQYTKRGERKVIWAKVREDNHVHDMYNYSYCAKEWLKLHLPKIEREFRALAEKQKSAPKPEPLEKSPKVSTAFINSQR